MELLLHRQIRTSNSTIGQLYVNNEPECYILEDTDRGLRQGTPLGVIRRNKVYGKTAIPAGRYEVVITWSDRFERLLPLLLNVPGYEGIRIHPGNTEHDTLGCLLPGATVDTDFVGNSRIAFARLFDKLKAVKEEKIFITIN